MLRSRLLVLVAAVARAGRLQGRRATSRSRSKTTAPAPSTTTITLDADAVRRVEANGRTLDAAFPLDDLGAAGWEISPWVADADGSADARADARPSPDKTSWSFASPS